MTTPSEVTNPYNFAKGIVPKYRTLRLLLYFKGFRMFFYLAALHKSEQYNRVKVMATYLQKKNKIEGTPILKLARVKR